MSPTSWFLAALAAVFGTAWAATDRLFRQERLWRRMLQATVDRLSAQAARPPEPGSSPQLRCLPGGRDQP